RSSRGPPRRQPPALRRRSPPPSGRSRLPPTFPLRASSPRPGRTGRACPPCSQGSIRPPLLLLRVESSLHEEATSGQILLRHRPPLISLGFARGQSRLTRMSCAFRLSLELDTRRSRVRGSACLVATKEGASLMPRSHLIAGVACAAGIALLAASNASAATTIGSTFN